MSIHAARVSSSFLAETFWKTFLWSSTAASNSKTLQSTTNLNNNNNDKMVWLWTALGLSVFGLKLCKNALEFYQFFSAWNRVWRRNHLRDNTSSSTTVQKRHDEIEEHLTTMTFDSLQQQFKRTNHTNETTTCVICLEDFQPDDRVRCSKTALSNNPACKHYFHADCLQTWLVKHSNCPTCRHPMLPEPKVWWCTNHQYP